jgi:hypothetical protein
MAFYTLLSPLQHLRDGIAFKEELAYSIRSTLAAVAVRLEGVNSL